jgi:hypothetical protein
VKPVAISFPEMKRMPLAPKKMPVLLSIRSISLNTLLVVSRTPTSLMFNVPWFVVIESVPVKPRSQAQGQGLGSVL